MVNSEGSRERLALFYMAAIVLIGVAVMVVQLFHLSDFSNVGIYILLILFLAIVEWFPIIFGRMSITLSFPLLYTLFLLYGLPITVVSYCTLLFLIYLLKRRPVRLLLFIPAQYAISLFVAHIAVTLLDPETASGLMAIIERTALFTGLYFLINNLVIDGVLLIRSQHYPKGHWLRKNGIESGIGLFSLTYLVFMFLLGSQNRGIVDVFTYLFFYSPLVAICVITTIIARLQKERNRLKALLTLTTELNRLLFSRQWRQNIEQLFKRFIDVEATALWVKVGEDWVLNHRNGALLSDVLLSDVDEEAFSGIRETQVYRNRKKESIPADAVFQSHLRAFVFAPLTVENETVGMLAVGRSRSQSFTSEEAQSMATLANQMAVLMKNYNLLSEQKKRILLEERNRIAREIHDGIAQSLAGAVMELETSERLFSKDTGKAKRLIRNCTTKLRESLKETRQSIYALRPYPTERSGLRKAIKEKIEEMENKSGSAISFREIGEVYPLGHEVKRVMYETISEALHNSTKHAHAEHIEICLSYQDDETDLTIKDDGVGFSLVDAMVKARQEPHFGILNMNEQADAIGASLQIDSSPEQGTTIQLLIKNNTEEEIQNDSSDVG